MIIEKEIKQQKFKNEHHKAVVNLIYTYNYLLESQYKLLKPFDITTQQFNVLRILRGQYPNPVTVKLIKERMLDKMSDASRIVEKLRLKGLVERQICPSNRRNVDVIITEKGLQILEKLDKHNPEMDKLLKNLDEKEVNKLNHILDKIRG